MLNYEEVEVVGSSCKGTRNKANNINAVVEKANVEKTKEERIVLRIKLKR